MTDLDILDRIKDLHRQATTERSHYYVASTLDACAQEIARLRALIGQASTLSASDIVDIIWLAGAVEQASSLELRRFASGSGVRLSDIARHRIAVGLHLLAAVAERMR